MLLLRVLLRLRLNPCSIQTNNQYIVLKTIGPRAEMLWDLFAYLLLTLKFVLAQGSYKCCLYT